MVSIDLSCSAVGKYLTWLIYTVSSKAIGLLSIQRWTYTFTLYADRSPTGTLKLTHSLLLATLKRISSVTWAKVSLADT